MARHRKYVVKLSDEEVQRLKKIIRNVKTSQTIRSRCQILLLLDMAHIAIQKKYKAVDKGDKIEA